MAITTQHSVFDELAEFIVSSPTLEAVIAYRASPATEARVHELLEKNREGTLSADEREEMQGYLTASHLMTLAKAKARLSSTP